MWTKARHEKPEYGETVFAYDAFYNGLVVARWSGDSWESNEKGPLHITHWARVEGAPTTPPDSDEVAREAQLLAEES